MTTPETKPKFKNARYKEETCGDKCPMCGVDDMKLEYGSIDFGGMYIFQAVTCGYCLSGWHNVYVFDGYNEIITEDGKVFDTEGKLCEETE
jgi:hypothetical protein